MSRKGGGGASRKRLSEEGGKRGTEKISRCARNDSVGDGYPVHHTKNVWEKRVSRIVIGSEVEGSFSLAVRRRASDSRKRETSPHGKADGVSRIVIGSGAEGSFSLAVRRRASDGEKRETPYRGKAVCHGNKKRGGDPSFFIYFDGSPSSSLNSPTVSAIASAPW